ncbi:MAG: phosphorelay protein [Thaumarchaeota archaeon]|nr:phosphorelay protein [Nitrososphaerota archaeon]
MSDEFTQVATKEINEELDGIQGILNSCTNDDDITNNSTDIEKHLHKIKGLAPMMGKKGVGEIAALNDTLMKKIIGGQIVEDIFEISIESIHLMKNLMNGSTTNIAELKAKLKTRYSEFFD